MLLRAELNSLLRADYELLAVIANSKVMDKNHMNEEIPTLESLPIGVEAEVTDLFGDNLAAKRLMEMGIVPGVKIRILKTAPAGDPLEILVRGYHLAIRRNEARTIGVKYEK